MWIGKEGPFETAGRNEIVDAAERFAKVANYFADPHAALLRQRSKASVDTTAITADFLEKARDLFFYDAARLGNAFDCARETVDTARLQESLVSQGFALLDALEKMRLAALMELAGKPLADAAADMSRIDEMPRTYRSAADAILLMLEAAWQESCGY